MPTGTPAILTGAFLSRPATESKSEYIRSPSTRWKPQSLRLKVAYSSRARAARTIAPTRASRLSAFIDDTQATAIGPSALPVMNWWTMGFGLCRISSDVPTSWIFP